MKVFGGALAWSQFRKNMATLTELLTTVTAGTPVSGANTALGNVAVGDLCLTINRNVINAGLGASGGELLELLNNGTATVVYGPSGTITAWGQLFTGTAQDIEWPWCSIGHVTVAGTWTPFWRYTGHTVGNQSTILARYQVLRGT